MSSSDYKIRVWRRKTKQKENGRSVEKLNVYLGQPAGYESREQIQQRTTSTGWLSSKVFFMSAVQLDYFYRASQQNTPKYYVE